MTILVQQGGAQQRPAWGRIPPSKPWQDPARRIKPTAPPCHAPDLSGREGPQLAGANFMIQWRYKTAGDLIGFMRSTMPPGANGSLPEQTLHQSRSVHPRRQRRAAWRSNARPGIECFYRRCRVGAACRRTCSQVAAAAPSVQQGKQDQGKQAPRGITVSGEVKNYVPVTDAMLRNPDPGDWLMIRRDYKANYYSPLNQITAQNVNDLRLVWSLGPCTGRGQQPGSQPAPIVHNGLLYVNNAGHGAASSRRQDG